MALVKWHRNENDLPVFSNLFDNIINGNSDYYSDSKLCRVPAANIIETKDDFRIEIAAPGLNKKDFSLNIENNLLTIEGGKEVKNVEESERFTRKEFSYNSFQRSFTLPLAVDSGNIEAKYLNGVLNITIPKKEEAKEKPAREIKIS